MECTNAKASSSCKAGLQKELLAVAASPSTYAPGEAAFDGCAYSACDIFNRTNHPAFYDYNAYVSQWYPRCSLTADFQERTCVNPTYFRGTLTIRADSWYLRYSNYYSEQPQEGALLRQALQADLAALFAPLKLLIQSISGGTVITVDFAVTVAPTDSALITAMTTGQFDSTWLTSTSAFFGRTITYEYFGPRISRLKPKQCYSFPRSIPYVAVHGESLTIDVVGTNDTLCTRGVNAKAPAMRIGAYPKVILKDWNYEWGYQDQAFDRRNLMAGTIQFGSASGFSGSAKATFYCSANDTDFRILLISATQSFYVGDLLCVMPYPKKVRNPPPHVQGWTSSKDHLTLARLLLSAWVNAGPTTTFGLSNTVLRREKKAILTTFTDFQSLANTYINGYNDFVADPCAAVKGDKNLGDWVSTLNVLIMAGNYYGTGCTSESAATAFNTVKSLVSSMDVIVADPTVDPVILNRNEVRTMTLGYPDASTIGWRKILERYDVYRMERQTTICSSTLSTLPSVIEVNQLEEAVLRWNGVCDATHCCVNGLCAAVTTPRSCILPLQTVSGSSYSVYLKRSNGQLLNTSVTFTTTWWNKVHWVSTWDRYGLTETDSSISLTVYRYSRDPYCYSLRCIRSVDELTSISNLDLYSPTVVCNPEFLTWYYGNEGYEWVYYWYTVYGWQRYDYGWSVLNFARGTYNPDSVTALSQGLVVSSQDHGTGGDNEEDNARCDWKCEQQCAKCVKLERVGQDQLVTIDVSRCRNSSNKIRWLGSKNDGSTATSCNGGAGSGSNRCDQVSTSIFKLKVTDSVISLQYRDKKMTGGVRCNGGKETDGKSSITNGEDCLGEFDSGCGSVSDVCNQVIPLSSCGDGGNTVTPSLGQCNVIAVNYFENRPQLFADNRPFNGATQPVPGASLRSGGGLLPTNIVPLSPFAPSTQRLAWCRAWAEADSESDSIAARLQEANDCFQCPHRLLQTMPQGLWRMWWWGSEWWNNYTGEVGYSWQTCFQASGSWIAGQNGQPWQRRCCYDTRSTFFDAPLITQYPSLLQASSGWGNWPDWQREQIFALISDTNPDAVCCKAPTATAQTCAFYRDRRPVGTGTTTPFRPLSELPKCNRTWVPQPPGGWGWGDPYCNTLDGAGFECNFWGEALWTSCGSWKVHVTAVPNAEGSNATIINGVAVREANDTIEILRNNQTGDAIVTFNGKKIDQTFSGGVLSVSFDISAQNRTLVRITSVNGHEVAVEALVHFFAVRAAPNRSCIGKCIGLLGNCDGDKENDLVSFDGTKALTLNATGAEIYSSIVQTYVVGSSEALNTSLFSTEVSVAPAEYTPVFVTATLLASCPSSCKGNPGCCLDASVGGSDFANQTVIAIQSANVTENASIPLVGYNFPPQLQFRSKLSVPVGIAVAFTVNATDSDGVATLVVEACSNTEFECVPLVVEGSTQKSIRVKLARITQNYTIKITSTDQKGAVATDYMILEAVSTTATPATDSASLRKFASVSIALKGRGSWGAAEIFTLKSSVCADLASVVNQYYKLARRRRQTTTSTNATVIPPFTSASDIVLSNVADSNAGTVAAPVRVETTIVIQGDTQLDAEARVQAILNSNIQWPTLSRALTAIVPDAVLGESSTSPIFQSTTSLALTPSLFLSSLLTVLAFMAAL
jgi:hypothetical protein